jgi:hypothetical protein
LVMSGLVKVAFEIHLPNVLSSNRVTPLNGRLACPLQTDPAAMRAAGAMKEVIDAAQEAFPRRDHWQATRG